MNNPNLPATTETHPALAKLAFVANKPVATDHPTVCAHALAYFAAVYGPRFQSSPDTPRAFVAELRDYTLEEIARAVTSSIRQRGKDGQNYPPSLADIIEGCESASFDRRSQDEAWAKRRAEQQRAY
jgi:hypothetical protein